MAAKRKGKSTGEEVIRTTCAHHCGGACLWKVHAKDRVITRLEPDDELRGLLRRYALRQQVYGPLEIQASHALRKYRRLDL